MQYQLGTVWCLLKKLFVTMARNIAWPRYTQNYTASGIPTTTVVFDGCAEK
ncbi:hypothetical protein PR003_g13022 [Phytophthora rubi]|uniref:Uncharacterized protein n=1 Tax=Phytophthora rubi TaxID=129364 RepID=A0A6A3M3K0_9STRA|nr:hypothetical protein PR002_g12384 [Phytophthora rubi]KAE9026661.1 hypothetical protein PR001_g12151 [Phytophthora rubi]KAE9335427.1 hypothetical protein PR003_g13022 [Phytophthora rubi]